MAQELNQPITEMRTRDISWGVKNLTHHLAGTKYHENCRTPGDLRLCKRIALPFL